MVLAAELYVNLNVIERFSHVDFKIEVPDYLPVCFVYCLCRYYMWAELFIDCEFVKLWICYKRHVKKHLARPAC
jgi:hypothetical protein